MTYACCRSCRESICDEESRCLRGGGAVVGWCPRALNRRNLRLPGAMMTSSRVCGAITRAGNALPHLEKKSNFVCAPRETTMHSAETKLGINGSVVDRRKSRASEGFCVRMLRPTAHQARIEKQNMVNA